jgi:hypothetical protein
MWDILAQAKSEHQRVCLHVTKITDNCSGAGSQQTLIAVIGNPIEFI